MSQVKDKIYGLEKIKEHVLIDLVNSSSLQRLKDVSQWGVPDKYYFKKGFSRYEHSLGVMILLRKLEAGLEEQIAGLLHDVSHTAFSHVIDWVIGDPTKEDYQDNTLFKVIENSEIPEVLNKYGIDYKKISRHENFKLLERDAPSLCADRIDYTLREINSFDKELSKKIFKNLFVKKNQIVFKNKEIAEIFAREYLNLQKNHWAGNQAIARYYLFAQILKKGLESELIYLNDLNKTEDFALNILENSEDNFILENLNLLKKGFDAVESEKGIELRKKFRYVDPEVSVNGKYKRLSSLSKDYFSILEYEKESSKLVNKIKIIPR